MTYLIITKGANPFYTNWFDADNHFDPYTYLMVVNLLTHTYTRNGKDWYPIAEDHL